MTTQGLLGFHYNGIDKLAYNQADSQPDVLGLRMLRELRQVNDWDTVRKRIDALTPIPESRTLDDLDGIIATDLRPAGSPVYYRGQKINMW